MQIIGSRRQPTNIILPSGHIKLMPHHLLLSHINASLNLYQGSFDVQERAINTETPGQGAAISGKSLFITCPLSNTQEWLQKGE